MANNRELSQFANVVGYNGGNIGIGTDNPGHILDLYNSAGTDCLKLNVNGDAGGSSKQNAIRFSVNGDVKAHMGLAVDVGRLISGSIANDFCIKGLNSNNILFATNSSERLRIDSSGRLLLACTSPPNSGVNAGLQIQHTSTANITLARNDSSITDGNALGRIDFYGNDGGTFEHCATIAAQADGAHADGDKPMRLIFGTSADGAATPTERLRIDSSGRLLVGHSANVAPDGYESLIQTSGTDYRGGSLSIRRDQNTSSGPALLLTKTRSGSLGGNTLVSNGDALGTIWFYGADGNDVNQAGAKIECNVDYTAGSNNMPGRLAFHVTSDGASSPTERMRIDSAGRVLMANVGSYYSSGEVLSLSTSNNGSVQVMRNTNASFNNSLIFGYASRSSNSAFQYIKLAANAASDTDFVLRGDGNAYADGSWYTGGADYAEYFEWSDGNASDEDRRGISVVLDGDKIREAVAGEDPIGVISGNPSVVGDAAWNKWNGKYLRDDFGSYIQEDYEVEDEDGNTVVQQRRQLNSAWSSENEYVTREDRAEWDTVGLMGKLRIRKGQVTGTRWVKMRDVSDTVEEWLLR